MEHAGLMRIAGPRCGGGGTVGAALWGASAGRVRGDRASVGLLSRMFRTDPEPFNTFVF